MRAHEFIQPKLFEIKNKYFYINYECIPLLEVYENPDQELGSTFERFDEVGYYSAKVFELSSRDALVGLIFTLRKDGSIDMGNIIPADTPKNNKLVHTSQGTQNNGADIGSLGVRWMIRKIKDFATSAGYNIQKISSKTRYTGARAKNNPGEDDSGLPKNFEVNQTLKEAIIYDCIADTFTILKN